MSHRVRFYISPYVHNLGKLTYGFWHTIDFGRCMLCKHMFNPLLEWKG